MINEYKLPIQLNVPQDFYQEETRCGYFVSSEMKKIWAVELDLLYKFQLVCKKYDIKYYADSGTLIGAVRHSGFIPWDDDIDLVMFREDYNKLLEVADKEFMYPYFLQNTYSDKMYFRGHSQLRNSKTTGFITSDIGKPYNKGIFIDIFVVDVIPDNIVLRKKYIKNINKKWDSLLLNEYYRKNPDPIFVKIHKLLIKHIYYRIFNYKYVFKKYEEYCAKYNNSDNESISYVEYSRGKEKHIWEKKWFNSISTVPFEFLTIEIPDGYDKRLKKEYGDYMTIKKSPNTHGEVTFDVNTSYEDYIIR